ALYLFLLLPSCFEITAIAFIVPVAAHHTKPSFVGIAAIVAKASVPLPFVIVIEISTAVIPVSGYITTLVPVIPDRIVRRISSAVAVYLRPVHGYLVIAELGTARP